MHINLSPPRSTWLYAVHIIWCSGQNVKQVNSKFFQTLTTLFEIRLSPVPRLKCKGFAVWSIYELWVTSLLCFPWQLQHSKTGFTGVIRRSVDVAVSAAARQVWGITALALTQSSLDTGWDGTRALTHTHHPLNTLPLKRYMLILCVNSSHLHPRHEAARCLMWRKIKLQKSIVDCLSCLHCMVH